MGLTPLGLPPIRWELHAQNRPRFHETEHPDVNVTNEVWVFRLNDPVNPWKQLPSMPYASTIPNLAVYRDKFYLLGGYLGDIGNRGMHRDGSPMNTDQVYVFEVGGSEYRPVEGLKTTPTSFRRMIQLNKNEWAAIGGYQTVDGLQDGIMKGRPGQRPVTMFEVFSIAE